VARIALNTALSLLVARRLGAEGLGKYAVLTAYIQVFQVFTALGLPQLVIREMARRPHERRYWFQGAVVTQLLAAGGGAAILILITNVLDYPVDTAQALRFRLRPSPLSRPGSRWA